MSIGAADCYEPTIDKEVYTEEDIAELYQKTLDMYIEEERAEYDRPPMLISFDEDELAGEFDPERYTFFVPGLFGDEDGEAVPRHPADREELMMMQKRMNELILETYEKRPPFDEEAAAEEFEEMYRDALEEPDEDLPEWVREAVDPRILAMDLLPEKIYRKLVSEDAASEERFDALDDEADEALEALRESLPENYQEFMDVLEELEDSVVLQLGMEKGFFSDGDEDDAWLEILMTDWNDQGQEVPRILKFVRPEILEDDGIEIDAWDEDGESFSDCDFIFGELYMEDGKPEVHLLFENNGLKYLTLRCSEAIAEYGWNNVRVRIGD